MVRGGGQSETIGQRFLLGGVLLCAAIEGAFACAAFLTSGEVRTAAGESTQGLADEWYIAAPDSRSCVKSGGPDQKIQDIRNTGDEPTVSDDNRGTVEVMREGPPGRWTFFRTMELCKARLAGRR